MKNFLGAVLRPAIGQLSRLLGWLQAFLALRANRRTACRAVEALDVQPGDHVIEVGCGPGLGMDLIAERLGSGRLCGVDPSSAMLFHARARIAAALRTGKAELRRTSAERLPYADGAFDKALALNGARSWPEVAAALREIARVLRLGGRLVIAFNRQDRHSVPAFFSQMPDAGFMKPRLVHFDDGEILIIARKGRPRRGHVRHFLPGHASTSSLHGKSQIV